jgi:hypothetical protein
MDDIEKTVSSVSQGQGKKYEKKVHSLKAYGLPEYVAMKNYEEGSLVQAILQCVSGQFCRLDKQQRSEVVRLLIHNYKWPQDLYGLCSLLDINCLVWLSARCTSGGARATAAALRRPTRLYTKWAIRSSRPWALLFSDGFGLLWCAVNPVVTGAANYLVDFHTGQQLYNESIQRACTNYMNGSIVLYNNEVYTIKDSTSSAYLIESNTDSSVQLTVSKNDIEASVAPEAQSPAELFNRSEEARRRVMGLSVNFTTLQFDVRHLSEFAHDTLKNN